MRLQALEIESFSKLKDLKIKAFSPGVTVIHGMNESGKTTLMEFIRSGMFSHNQRKRYPNPQDGDRGILHFVMDDGESMRIEREKNRISRPEGGPLPDDIFAMDLITYEGIFAMGLENLEKGVTENKSIKNRFLNVAGASGLNSAISACETEISSLLAGRRSRDPKTLLDRAMLNVDNLQAELAELQDEMDQHESLMQEQEEAEEGVSRLLSSREELLSELRRHQRLGEQWGNWLRLTSLEDEVRTLAPAESFPRDGLREMESLQKDIKSADYALRDLNLELERLRESLSNHERDAILDHDPQVRRLQGLVGAYRFRRETTAELREAIRLLETGLKQESASLGWSVDLFSVPIDLELESGLRLLEGSMRDLRDRDLSLSALIEANDSLQLESDRQDWDGLRLLSRYREDVTSLEKEIALDQSLQRHRRSLISSLSGISIALGVGVAALASQVIPGIALLLAGGVGLFYALYVLPQDGKIPSSLQERREALNIREEEMRANGLDPTQEMELSISALQESHARGLQDDAKVNRREELQKQQAELKEEREKKAEELRALLSSKGLPPSLDIVSARESIPRLQSLQKDDRELKQQREKLLAHENQEREEDEEMEALCRELGMECPDFPTGAALLSERLGQAKSGQIAHERNQEQESRKLQDKQVLEEELALLREQWAELLGDMDEESFRLMGENYNLLKRKEQEMTSLRNSMLEAFGGEESFNKAIQSMRETELFDLEARESSLSLQFEERDREVQEASERIGSIKLELEKLRTDEKISLLAQNLEGERAEAMLLTKRYARAALALQLMEAARDRFMKERQPSVISSANRYLEMMTEGRYEMILDMSSMEVTVEERDGLEQKGDGQWSSGLGDQIQLSLRLAMAEEMGKRESLPLMLDDVLVRFDQVRKDGAAKAIHAFSSQGRQALIFTCDKGTISAFQNLPGVTFLRLKNGQVLPEKDALSLSV